jgi:hypothetical protein
MACAPHIPRPGRPIVQGSGALSQWFSSLAEDGEVVAMGKEAIAARCRRCEEAEATVSFGWGTDL